MNPDEGCYKPILVNRLFHLFIMINLHVCIQFGVVFGVAYIYIYLFIYL